MLILHRIRNKFCKKQKWHKLINMPETCQLHDLSTWDQPQKWNLLYNIIYSLERKQSEQATFYILRLKSFRPTDPFLPCKFGYVDRYPWEFNILQERVTKQSRKSSHSGAKERRKWPLNVTQTTAKIRLIRSVKAWNPPKCNLGILDIRTNKNFQRLAKRSIPN